MMCAFFCRFFRHSGYACFAAGLFSLVSLIAAYISQYVFGLQPCVLCLYQRAPHFAAVALGIVAVALYKGFPKLHKAVALLLACCFLTGSGIAAYHTGVEQGYIEMEKKCDEPPVDEDMSFEEMSAALMEKEHVPCDKPAFVFLGLSMAAWNFVFSFAVAIYLLYVIIRDRRTVIKPV